MVSTVSYHAFRAFQAQILILNNYFVQQQRQHQHHQHQ